MHTMTLCTSLLFSTTISSASPIGIPISATADVPLVRRRFLNSGSVQARATTLAPSTGGARVHELQRLADVLASDHALLDQEFFDRVDHDLVLTRALVHFDRIVRVIMAVIVGMMIVLHVGRWSPFRSPQAFSSQCS